jgi:crotonobetainyl-CoA:carnitine CoA-transferase CaiB-like acyl-CoA transferase
MGFGYDVLKELNPRIVMVNVSAYGQYGPYRDRVGFDTIGQAISGMMSLTGFPDGPPVKTYFPLIDRITSLHATIGALAALRERESSGQGQAIDVCLADTGFTTNEIPISSYLGDGTVQEREGNGAGSNNAYQTSDGWIFLIANHEKMFSRLCEAMEKSEWLNDPRFADTAGRAKHADVLESGIGEWFAARTTREATDYLADFSIPCAPVNNVEQAANDPHVHEREIMMEVPDPVAGSIHVTGKMIKFSRTPMVVGSAPLLGEHTDEVLTGILGYSSEQVQSLQDEAVVHRANG